MTLDTERGDAGWTLVGMSVKINAREGESITQPKTDFRQQRSAKEVALIIDNIWYHIILYFCLEACILL